MGTKKGGENSIMGLSNIKSCNVKNIDNNSGNNDLFVSCHGASMHLAIKEKKLADLEISAAEAAVTRSLPESYHSIKKRYICINAIDDIDSQLREVKINMSLYKLVEIYDRQIKFLLFSLSFVIMSLVGIILYNRSGYYIIHPTIYLLTLLMGLGWTCTAIGSILNNKGVKAWIKKS